MPDKKLNIALIGSKFMGKAHSHAWRNVGKFFETGTEPVLKVVCAQEREALEKFAAHWGWGETTTRWEDVVSRPDIDIVDVAAPTWLHFPIVMAATQAGKHIFCEKPFALDSGQAAKMLAAAKRAGIVHYLNHNYRRCPAVALAQGLVEAGRLGRIFHWRGAYLQSWIVDPAFPLTWQLRRETAGAGPHADLNSHSVDLARFLAGEITSVMSMTSHFVTERPLADASAGAFQAVSRSHTTGPVTVEDASFMLAEFENGALGSFEATRFAPGRKNYNCFEVYGSRGSLAFNLEKMNELQYFSADDPASTQGFRTILVTEPDHPYMRAWWPPGHIIGYEHTFIHAAADFLKAIVAGQGIRPNFEDGLRIMEILDAGLQSALEGRRISVASPGDRKTL
jgi:predicted dehydrogenase